MVEEGALADLSLPAAIIATATKLAVRVHRHVAKFGADTCYAAEHPSIVDNPAAETNTSADIQHLIMILRRAKVMFSQRCDVGLVVHDQGSLGKRFLQHGAYRERFPPSQVGSEQHRSRRLIDQGGHADPDTQERAIFPISPLNRLVQKCTGVVENHVLSHARVRMFLVTPDDFRSEIGAHYQDKVYPYLTPDDKTCRRVEVQHDCRVPFAPRDKPDLADKMSLQELVHQTRDCGLVEARHLCQAGARNGRFLAQIVHDHRQVDLAYQCRIPGAEAVILFHVVSVTSGERLRVSTQG